MLNIFAKTRHFSCALVLAVLFAGFCAPSQSHAQNIISPNTSHANAKAKPDKKTSNARRKTKYRIKIPQTKPAGASARYKKPLKPQKYGSTLVFEPATGRILHHYNIDALTYPASLTKMMTAYVVFEAIQEGRDTHTLTLQSNLRFTPYARSQPATRVGLKAGIDVTIDTAVRALIIRSANDFAVALAETISGSETAFIDRMNATARRLGMSRTNFVNPHGLPNPHQVSTARDFAVLTSAIIRDFPQYADVFSNPTVKIRSLTLNTHNSLLKNFEGTDGMKTGFTCASGYNIVASATRDGRRLAVVVIGALTGAGRNTRAKALLSQAFDRLNGIAPVQTASIRTAPAKTVSVKVTPAKTTTIPIPTRKNAAYKTATGKAATANSTAAKIPPTKTKPAKRKAEKKKPTKTAPAHKMPVDLMPSDNVSLASLPVPALLTSTTLDLTRKTRTWVCGNRPKPRSAKKRRKKSKKHARKKSKKKKK